MPDRSEVLATPPLFWLVVPLAGALTWGLHELAHFQAGRWLGYEMWVSLNQAGPVQGDFATTTDRVLVAMAGPLVTYLQATLALILIQRRRLALAYPFLFFALAMRLVAFAVGFVNPNDEARTSLDLGLPVWALPSIVVGVLLGMTILGSRTLRVGWRTNLLLYLAASAFTTLIVFADPVVGILLSD